jgi:hypothetical protein
MTLMTKDRTAQRQAFRALTEQEAPPVPVSMRQNKCIVLCLSTSETMRRQGCEFRVAHGLDNMRPRSTTAYLRNVGLANAEKVRDFLLRRVNISNQPNIEIAQL